MYEIQPIPIRKFELVDMKIKEDQLIYCTDSREAYYDLTDQIRIQLGCTIQLDTERDRMQLVDPLNTKIYIIKEENILYIYHSNDWHVITNRSEIIDLLVPAELLIPTTLRKKGINLAPKTLASEVLTADGRQLQNVLDEMLSDNKKILLYTKTVIIEVERDGQRVFNIPFPIANYDIKKFPILIFLNNQWIPGSNYCISKDQVIFNPDFDFLRKGDLLTFIFNYNVTISSDDTINATSLNNIRYFVGDHEPIDKIETDVWFDTLEKEVKQYDGLSWNKIVDTEHATSINGVRYFVGAREPLFKSKTDVWFDIKEKTIKQYNGDSWEIIVDTKHATHINDIRYFVSRHEPIDKIETDVWFDTTEKAIKQYNGKTWDVIVKDKDTTFEILKSSYTLNKDSNQIPINIDGFNNTKDLLMVYENSIYIEENENYIISEDCKNLINANGERWLGKDENIIFNYIIFKNMKKN